LYSLPGLEQWRAFQTGRAPRSPLHRLTGYRLPGYRLTRADSGAVVLTLPRPDWLQRADCTIDVSVLIELASAGAATTVTGPGCAPEPTSVSIQHLRPATLKGEKFSAKAHVLNSIRHVPETRDGQRLAAHIAVKCELSPAAPLKLAAM